MQRKPVQVKKTGPGLANLHADLDRMKHSEVLVGIPAAKAMRKGDPINNASLLFVLTHGSPIRHIPPTPIVEPAVKKDQRIITPHMGAAAKAILDRDPAKANRELNLAGTIAVNGIKKYFVDPDNGWPPNAPSTLARKLKRERKKLRKGKITVDEYAAAEAMVKRNIDTGNLRNSMTYILRENR